MTWQDRANRGLTLFEGSSSDASLHLIDDLTEDGDTAMGVEAKGEGLGLLRRCHRIK